ncbi:FkbM family methyltransferase [Leptospira limi]|uniref:FkbM family methyltransferase n=1 Tax=Leptospira limi TaxID=2950023 RepID=A0ABT3LZ31_9LEPT|nr:FkbM family methyltransferase [Leptospira limi]MCW7462968.1 FkbM family methyltransferase [Leptospira limi]
MKSLLRRFVIWAFANPISRRIINLELYNFFENVKVKTDKKDISFFGFGDVPVWRAKTLFTKEPETIDWINTFPEGSVFWDIGANVGSYSVYAASRDKGLKVLAFEPSAANYFLLNRNIFLNRMDDAISAYAVAFNDQDSLGFFHMNSDLPGGAMNLFSEEAVQETKIGLDMIQMNCKQAMVSYSIDSFVELYKPPFPNYIKIDVDNIEDKIVKGGLKTIRNPKVKSVLIELDDNDVEYGKKVLQMMKKAGFHNYEKKHSPMFENSKFSSFYNYIFYRK